jgi:hypothetical protein
MLGITLIINTLPTQPTTNTIISSTSSITDIPCNITLHTISSLHRTITMDINRIIHTEDTMDTKVATTDKQGVMLTIANRKSVCFLPWQLIKTVCLIVSAMFGRRW